MTDWENKMRRNDRPALSAEARARILRLDRTLGAFGRDDRGVAAVEFAMIITFLSLALMGVVDFGRYISTGMELEQALRAGGQFALEDHTDSATIAAAVQGATNLTVGNVTVGALTCECPDGSSTACRGDVTYTLCTGDVVPAGFVTLSATATYDPIFVDMGWFSSNMTIQQDLTFRVK